MNDGFLRNLKGVEIGPEQRHANMVIYCLLSAQEAEVDFITLDDALEKDLLTITEVDNTGHVPELKVANSSTKKALMLDGEELIGAKQNRTLNTTILMAPESESIIPVSCIEQGRWSYKSKKFKSARRTLSAEIKRKKTRSVSKSLDLNGSYASEQHTVWKMIDAKFEKMSTPRSHTMAASDLYDHHAGSAEEYLKSFKPVDNQIGFVAFIDGNLVGLELINNYSLFKDSHSKLVQSYVLDALETSGAQMRANSNSLKCLVLEFLEEAATAPITRRASISLGNDIRINSPIIEGAGLEYENQIIHLTIFTASD
jgi:flavodoxin